MTFDSSQSPVYSYCAVGCYYGGNSLCSRSCLCINSIVFWKLILHLITFIHSRLYTTKHTHNHIHKLRLTHSGAPAHSLIHVHIHTHAVTHTHSHTHTCIYPRTHTVFLGLFNKKSESFLCVLVCQNSVFLFGHKPEPIRSSLVYSFQNFNFHLIYILYYQLCLFLFGLFPSVLSTLTLNCERFQEKQKKNYLEKEKEYRKSRKSRK